MNVQMKREKKRKKKRKKKKKKKKKPTLFPRLVVWNIEDLFSVFHSLYEWIVQETALSRQCMISHPFTCE